MKRLLSNVQSFCNCCPLSKSEESALDGGNNWRNSLGSMVLEELEGVSIPVVEVGVAGGLATVAFLPPPSALVDPSPLCLPDLFDTP